MALCAESAVLGEGRRYLRALEQHPPNVLVHRVIELSQRLVLGRFELPQTECPSLTRENPAEELDLDHIEELDFLAHHVPDAGLESVQLYRRTQDRPFSFQEVSRMGIPDRNSGAATQLVSRGSVM